METLNTILSALDKIQGLSAVALVFFSCIVIGYVLRFVKAFPNNAIPVVVILWGALAMLFIADPRATTMPARIWTARNVFVGLIIGFVAWFTHKIVLSRLEDMIASKFNLGDTQFFSKGPPDSTDTTTKTDIAPPANKP